MAEKLHEYQGFIGRCHSIRDDLRNKWNEWKEAHPGTLKERLSGLIFRAPKSQEFPEELIEQGIYGDIFRKKTRAELMRISAAVMGIEFSYAAETAFVSPTLLQIGVKHQNMTMVWALSPIVGFFLTPILGSLSDKCRSHYGRRRPFIFLLSLGVFLGLILVPNGEYLGYSMGDIGTQYLNATVVPEKGADHPGGGNSHPWGVLFTVLGTVLLDFDADACQSPARAYLLDVTVPEDHARGLSTFTIMAGLGGFMGYSLGGINWDNTSIGIMFGGHVRAVFSLITIIFVVCVSATLTSFKEIPLDELNSSAKLMTDTVEVKAEKIQTENGSVDVCEDEKSNFRRNDLNKYGSVDEKTCVPIPEEHQNLSLQHYLKSIVVMPPSMRMVCLTNLFCWMAHVCYSLYFTDFVGEAVLGGDPAAPEGSESRINYESGVRLGCWGMAMYSLSCACYSTVIEKLIKIFGARKVYVGGLCTYSVGMWLMCLTRAKVSVVLFSWTAGVMYSTLFTMPYLLIAHYHATGTWDSEGGNCGELRGIGTDVAVVSSCVFVAQLLVSIIAGTAVKMAGTTSAIVAVAATLAGVAAFCATKITYLDL